MSAKVGDDFEEKLNLFFQIEDKIFVFCRKSAQGQLSFDQNALKEHIQQISQWSEEANRNIPHRSKVKYGETERSNFNVYSEDLPGDSPIFVFIHGGAWVFGSNDYYGYLAETFREIGIVTATVTYDLSPSANITEMVEEIKQCMTAIVQLAQKRNSKGIYLSGHSSGAHLAAMLMSSEWMADPINKKIIKGIILISGPYDLTEMSGRICKAAKITPEIAEKASPIKFAKNASKNLGTDIKLFMAAAENDMPKLLEQSKKYHQELIKQGVCATFFLVKDEDHFTIVEKLHNKDHAFTKASLDFCEEEKSSTD